MMMRGAYGLVMRGGVRLVMMMRGSVRLVAVGDDDAWGRTIGCCG